MRDFIADEVRRFRQEGAKSVFVLEWPYKRGHFRVISMGNGLPVCRFERLSEETLLEAARAVNALETPGKWPSDDPVVLRLRTWLRQIPQSAPETPMCGQDAMLVRMALDASRPGMPGRIADAIAVLYPERLRLGGGLFCVRCAALAALRALAAGERQGM